MAKGIFSKGTLLKDRMFSDDVKTIFFIKNIYTNMGIICYSIRYTDPKESYYTECSEEELLKYFYPLHNVNRIWADLNA